MNPDNRLFALDVLRGLAVMGIVLMNIVGFAMPEAAYINPHAWGGTSFADIAAWTASFILIDGKMRAVFSMLFGASALLVIDRAELAGRNGLHEQMIRCGWLLAIGLAHFLLLWWGDILMLYAIVGLAIIPFAGREPLDLVKWAFLAFGAYFLIVAIMVLQAYAFRHAAGQPDASAETVSAFAHYAGALGGDAAAIARDIALHRSGFGAIFADSLKELPTHVFTGALFFGPDTFGFMLLGMAMLKGGFFTGTWPAEHYLRTARHCLLIGLLPMIALGGWAILSDFEAVTTFGVTMAWSFPFRVPLAVGYAALGMWMVQRLRHAGIVERIAAAGRASLSNYLGTSLLMTALFYGWGLGLFGHVSRAPLYLFALPVWALMLLWSKPWLDRFAYGPVEWLWRSLTRGRILPLRLTRKAPIVRK